MKKILLCSIFASILMVNAAIASDTALFKGKVSGPEKSYSPFVGESYPKNAYWGDTHLHTSNSFDAGFVNFRVGPEEAFRFASGEEIMANNGMQIKLVRPLDFLVVSDHAEYLGLTPALRASDPLLLKTDAGARWSKALLSGDYDKAYKAAMEAIGSVGAGNEMIKSDDFKKSSWEKNIATADKMNQPGKFTAFIAYEFTSMPNKGNNLHRVVIFKDDSERAGQVVPFSMFDSENPEDLWVYMANYEEKTGGNILAIPHNGNLSNGTMFAVETFKGKPLTKEYAEMRSKWEPLIEITQIKGDGETHPYLSPNDEFANFGTWDKGNLTGAYAKTKDMLEYEYARSALKNGLKLEKELGVNPFKFGFVGGTDAHTGVSSVKEENFWGKHSGLEPDSHRATDHKVLESPIDDKLTTWGWEQVAGGLAAVWATDNTRESLFEAMERKETYGTTGSRISLRFFGGWDFTKDDIQQPSPAKIGYKKGVPMGGDLTNAPKGKSPSFMVWALRDPEGANLDRVQIIKGWMDKKDKLHEKVYNVAWSTNLGTSGSAKNRKLKKDGKLSPIGSTVNLSKPGYTNTIGDVYLATVWSDPDYNSKERAFYYARVLEIPTPSWLAYDKKFFNIDITPEAEMVIQERAYSSAIWYTP